MKNFFIIAIIGMSLPLCVFAVTDAVNIGLSVTGGNTSGGGGGDDPTPVSGCTDPVAINYNPLATVSNGSCNYVSTAVPNVTNFVSVYTDGDSHVTLTWNNPAFANFDGVRLVRKLNSIAVSPNEGTLVYDGSGQTVVDQNLTVGATYYYSIFVRSTSGDYSSGVITFEVLPGAGPTEEPTPTDPVPGCTDVAATNYNPLATANNGSCTYATSTLPEDIPPEEEVEQPSEPPAGDPFNQFPTADSTDPLLVKLSLGDFVFLQSGNDKQFFTLGASIKIDGSTPFTIYLPVDKVPNTLKAIGMTLVDPDNPTKSFSFLLRLNEDRTGYVANIGALGKDGLFPVFAYVINYQDQTIKRIEGTLSVTGVTPRTTAIPRTIFLKGLVPASIATGLLAGAAQTVAVASQVTSFLDLYLLLARWFTSFLSYFGFRRKTKPWGTVYDAVTKRPIDPAYVSVARVTDPDTEVASAITDIDGRYGLFLQSDAYTLKAGKTHYEFPSKLLAGKNVDELYDNLYFGTPFTTSGNEVVSMNIPLDPVGFDWNEFVKGQTSFFKVYSAREARRKKFVRVLVWVGLTVSIFSTVVTPSFGNLFVLLCYGLLFSAGAAYRYQHRLAVIRRRDTGEPIPFAIVRAFYAGLGQEVKHVVTDVVGRFYMLLRPGDYYFTVEHRQPDGSYAKVYQSGPMTLAKGILREDLLV